MPTKRFNRRTVRIRGYDYSTPGAYFVTICSHGKKCTFGEIADEQVRLTRRGKIIAACWREVPKHFTHASLDFEVIMPNHMHGIVIIEHELEFVGTRHAVSLQKTFRRKFGKPISGSLDTIIRSFKSAVTKAAHQSGIIGPVWQPRFYEHVIRNEKELYRIRNYIQNNPKQWEIDKENPENRKNRMTGKVS